MSKVNLPASFKPTPAVLNGPKVVLPSTDHYLNRSLGEEYRYQPKTVKKYGITNGKHTVGQGVISR